MPIENIVNADNLTELDEGELEFAVIVNPGFFKIAEPPLLLLKQAAMG